MTFKFLAAAAMAAALSACVPADRGRPAPSPMPAPDPFAQTISFQSGLGSLAMDQSFAPGAGSPGNARVCFSNSLNAAATLLHGVPGINPMRAAPGGRSCANFPAASRVDFTLVLDQGLFPVPAVPDRNFVYSMGPFNGGVLSLNLRQR